MHVEGTPLLLTKLAVPPPRAHTMARERLLALIPATPGTRLVLLSAPAGFGKTTFLSTWCHVLVEQHQAATAWLTLDEADNDPARFLAYLIAAATRALGRPRGRNGNQIPPVGSISAGVEVVLTRLINTLAALDGEVVLVLDDYHVISAPAIHAAVAYLLDHLPDRARLAIGSRADPPLQLARLRAREQLIELRASDLRFTPDEVQVFLQNTSNLALAPDEAQAVGAYVEGWPAGVQLVALALRSAPHGWAAEVGDAAPGPSARHVLDHLTSNPCHIFGYLADEIFERQPAHLKAFLLQTAILDRMCGPLCDAVIGDWRLGIGGWPPNPQSPVPNPQSQMLLEELEHANLFVIPLDGERRWYRYHHLFQAFLCARLNREPPLVIADLHRRASAWCECNQLLPQAVEHALAAGEVARAAELIEGLAMAVIERGEYATLHRWLEQIPEDILQARPALCLWAAWAALLAGEVERIEPLLGRAERAWRAAGDRRKLGEVAHLLAHLARLRLDAPQTIEAARQALANLAEEDPTLRAGSTLALGAGQLLTGDLAAASATLAEAYISCQAHNYLGMLVALTLLGDLARQQGHLQEATRRYQDAIQAVGERALWERWEAAIRLGDLARERNDLDQALDMLHTALRAAEQAGVAAYLPAGYIALARTLAARADFSAARIALDRALHGARRLHSPALEQQIHAICARLALARGDLVEAERWYKQLTPDLASDPGYARELEALTLARVLIAQGRSDPASRSLHVARSLLERLRQEAETHGRTGSLIEILALAALADAAVGRRDQALRLVRQALVLAAPEQYARIFLDEGAPMQALIAECRGQIAQPGRRMAGDDMRQLLTAIDRLLAAFPDAGASQGPASGLVEPLSEREREVLRLMAEGASNQAIAAALVISIGTVKSHINHILGKLAARNRTEAGARARELGLLMRKP